jgi:SPP1 family predicted phage head-tail adaptor
MKIPRRKFRQLLEHQKRSITQDEIGGKDETWTTLGTHWGSIEFGSARETVIAGQLGPKQPVTIYMRYPGEDENVSSKDRIVWTFDGVERRFNIESVNDIDNLHFYLELLCTEIPK